MQRTTLQEGLARGARCVLLGILLGSVLNATAQDWAKPDSERKNFVRGGFAYLKLNDRSSDARDITGPVVRTSDNGLFGLLGVPDVGLPKGVRADVGNSSSGYMSFGRFLTPDWALEAIALAAPFKHEIYGKGTIERLGPVATVKQLPPTLVLHRYFRDASATVRPSLGLGVNYTRFFSARATPALEAYTGGPTDIKLSSSTGPAAFAGAMWQVDKRLHVNFLVGYVKVKTTATLTTRNTQLTAASPVLQDSPAPVPGLANNPLTGPVVTGILNDIAQRRGGSLGTFERQLDLQLDPTVFAISVGYRF
jgi:outer membrane protein W